MLDTHYFIVNPKNILFKFKMIAFIIIYVSIALTFAEDVILNERIIL